MKPAQPKGWSPTAGLAARGLAPTSTPPSQGLVIAFAVVAAGFWAATGDWLAPVGLCVLWAGWRWLPRLEGPPVLALAFTFQWLQVTVGIYYRALTGRSLPPFEESDYRPMVMVGLGCLVALLVGVRFGATFRRRAAALPTDTESAIPLRGLLLAYVAATLLEAPLRALAWRIPPLTQAILALSMLRLGLVFLLFRKLAWPRFRGQAIAGLLVFEVLLGFTGYFAEFREPLMMLTLVLLERFDPRRARDWTLLGGLVSVAFLAGLLWLGIRTDYRKDFELDAFANSRSARFERIGGLSGDFLKNGAAGALTTLDFYVDRLWAIYYPALALSRVPSVLPHEGGSILFGAIRHVFMPRLLFPDKGVLPSDSEMVRKYSGVWVASEEQGTSIAFGYAAESYVDFGVPLLFLPIVAWGVILGRLYRLFLESIRHRDLALGFVSVVFWLSFYLFERSWITWIGFSLTLIIYLGSAVFAIDRMVLARQARPLRFSRA